jgi:hypothetical protein
MALHVPLSLWYTLASVRKYCVEEQMVNTGFKIALGITAAVVLAVVGVGAGWLIWGRSLWQPGPIGGPGMMWDGDDCTQEGGIARNGLFPRMGEWLSMPGQRLSDTEDEDSASGSVGCQVPETASPSQISIDQARSAVEHYIVGAGNRLEIDELMEFEDNYYAIVRERDSGIGAMELLVDKTTGDVSPEIGPNMMWNARYGMHAGRGMMGGSGAVNELSGDQAVAIAQSWLDEHQPGVLTEGHADAFYGYYTIHTLKDGHISGMLSVHGRTGQVWYHTWHGAFVQMVEVGEDES